MDDKLVKPKLSFSSVEWPIPKHRTKLWNASSTAAVTTVGLLSKLLIEWLNDVKVCNKDILMDALDKRQSKTPLLTFSNHYSCIDDPAIWGMLHLRHFLKSDRVRWSLAAHDICFTNRLHSLVFSLGKCIPIIRGDGVYQKAMNFCVSELNNGKWIHIFPEAKVNVLQEFIRLKWGIGRLITDARTLPLVIPMYHIGMDNVLPNTEPYIPRFGKKVTINIGEPMDFSRTLEELKAKNANEMEKRKIITDLIQDKLLLLKKETLQIHANRR